MNINLTEILLILVIFQLLLVSSYLFTQEKGKRISNQLLGCFFLSIALNLLDVFLLMSGVYSAHPRFACWGNCLPLLFGPLIYLYTQSMLINRFEIARKVWKHFIPFFICFLTTAFYFLAQPEQVQRQILSAILHHHLPRSVSIATTLIFLQFLGYVIASLKSVSVYKEAIVNHFSSKKQANVGWLYSTILFFVILVVVSILNGMVSLTPLATFYLAGFNIVVLAMLVFVVTMLLRALRKPYFFSFSETEIALPQPLTIESERIARTITDHMEQNKPFLESELTLEDLASQLSMKPRALSQIINEKLGQNFYDFINRYRITEASRLLTDPADKKMTIQEVFYQVGFNSKSSFNSLFKKYTGLTPNEFRKQKRG